MIAVVALLSRLFHAVAAHRCDDRLAVGVASRGGFTFVTLFAFGNFDDSVAAAETLRLELERYRSELGECRKRMGEREQGEALLAGEKRILEMIAKSSPLEPILDALCRLVEEVSNGSLATILLLDSESNRLWHAAAPD